MIHGVYLLVWHIDKTCQFRVKYKVSPIRMTSNRLILTVKLFPPGLNPTIWKIDYKLADTGTKQYWYNLSDLIQHASYIKHKVFSYLVQTHKFHYAIDQLYNPKHFTDTRNCILLRGPLHGHEGIVFQKELTSSDKIWCYVRE